MELIGDTCELDLRVSLLGVRYEPVEAGALSVIGRAPVGRVLRELPVRRLEL